MSVKRARVSESSFSTSDLLSHMTSPVDSVKEVQGMATPSAFIKPTKFPRPSIENNNTQEIQLPTVVTSLAHESTFVVSEFLKRCYYCKKRIKETGDVFMYGDFHAFCTPECREIQMELDDKVEKQLAIQKERVQESMEVDMEMESNLKGGVEFFLE